MVRIAWADAAWIVTIPMRVTGSQVIVTEGVKQDGWEANVINVRIVFFLFYFFWVRFWKKWKYWYFLRPFYLLWTYKIMSQIPTVWYLHEILMKTYSKYKDGNCFPTRIILFLISKIILNINLKKQLIAVFENKDLYAIEILIYQVKFIM